MALRLPPAAAQQAPAAPAQVPPPAAAKPPATLDILEYDVKDNTVLDELAIDQALEPFLGPGKTLDDVDHAREALEKAYQSRGFKTVAVLIPKQTVHDGVVQLQVAEGRVGHLDVVGARYTSIEAIKQQIPSLAEGSVPDFNQVQKDLVALNQSADRRVTPALKAGSAPGTVDVDLAVTDHLPVGGSLELNNRKSQNTSELRSVASLSYDNLWQAGHSLSASYQTAPENPDDAEVEYVSYLAHFGASPFSLLFNYVHSNSNVATIGSGDVIGQGSVAGVRGVYTFPGSADFYGSISFGIDYKHFRNRTTVAGASFVTPITYYPLTLSYDSLLRGESYTLQQQWSVVSALPEFGSSSFEYGNDRYRARGQQLSFHFNLIYTKDWDGGAESLVRATWQLADQPLISNEQFAAGGLDSVRGYLEAEVLGDYGFTGTAELRSPSYANAIHFGGKPLFDDLRVFGFVDGGRVVLRDALAGDQQPVNTLASFGVGLNLRLFSYLNGSLNWADPVLNGPATKAWSGSRLLFRVWGNF